MFCLVELVNQQEYNDLKSLEIMVPCRKEIERFYFIYYLLVIIKIFNEDLIVIY